MRCSYKDIIDRIPTPPTWWDCNGAPRFGEFHPSLSANFHAYEVILLEIACQNCKARFLVEMNADTGDWIEDPETGEEVQDSFSIREPHYGDPPNSGCCLPGPSMNSYRSHIVEFWRRGQGMNIWVRHRYLECIKIDEIPD